MYFYIYGKIVIIYAFSFLLNYTTKAGLCSNSN
jgi:hypothetical protein